MSRTDFSKGKKLALGVCLLITGSATGTAVANALIPESDDPTPPMIPTAYTDSFERREAAASTEEAVEEALRGLDADLFVSAEVGPPPPEQKATGGQWFAAELRDTAAVVPLSLWEADLAQGAIAEQLARDTDNLADVITGSTFTSAEGTDPGYLVSGAGDVRSGQVFSSASQSDEDIVKQAGSVVDSFGLRATEIRVLHPLDPALIVRLQVESSSEVRGRFADLQMALIGIDNRRYEGLYLEILGADGKSLAVSSVALRTGAGRMFVLPGVETDMGILPRSDYAPDLSGVSSGSGESAQLGEIN